MKWEPIETAPETGPRILAATYDAANMLWDVEVVSAGDFITSSGDVFPATHWQHLPEPPATDNSHLSPEKTP